MRRDAIEHVIADYLSAIMAESDAKEISDCIADEVIFHLSKLDGEPTEEQIEREAVNQIKQFVQYTWYSNSDS